jgi:hypothetical protein
MSEEKRGSGDVAAVWLRLRLFSGNLGTGGALHRFIMSMLCLGPSESEKNNRHCVPSDPILPDDRGGHVRSINSGETGDRRSPVSQRGVGAMESHTFLDKEEAARFHLDGHYGRGTLRIVL